jgi:Na+/melibiose symporter-like transporter
MRSYQILTIIGSLFVIYDLIFAAHQLSISVLVVSGFAIISMFLFKNNTKSIGIGLIVLSVVMLYAIGNFGLLRSRHPEMALFVAGAIAALRYKD